jgi:hypothetical protein
MESSLVLKNLGAFSEYAKISQRSTKKIEILTLYHGYDGMAQKTYHLLSLYEWRPLYYISPTMPQAPRTGEHKNRIQGRS